MILKSMDALYDLVVVGGGPAGMAAAVAAREAGIDKVLIAERNAFLGGVLPQCVHDGFGVTEFGESMTGPEYAEVWKSIVDRSGIQVLTDTTVIRMTGDAPYTLSLTGSTEGLRNVGAKSVILSTGCRERTLGNLHIPGSRPAGIYTAGSAQYMMNRQNYLPGKSVVILGSGDIGLIMARRLTLEGASVKMILGERASGLLRNYIQCVQDFDIPIRFGNTVLRTHGYKRLKGVTIAPLDESGKADETQSSYIPCDTLLIAAGLIPETELWRAQGLPLEKTGGIPVDDSMRTKQDGIFACGNAVRIYDTVDEVTSNGRRAGYSAAQWVFKNDTVSFDLNIQGNTPSLGRKITTEDIDVLFGGRINRYSKIFYCIQCPQGCKIEAVDKDGELSLSGAGCGLGEAYVKAEYHSPARVVTSTVKVKRGATVLLPVKTDRPVPKAAIRGIMDICRKLEVESPIRVGDIIVSGAGGTKANIIATGNLL